MKKIISFFTLAIYFLFWLIFFQLNRLFFVGYFYRTIDAPFEDVSLAFAKGLRMDLSMAGYFCALPLLLWIIQWFFHNFRIPSILAKIYSYSLMVTVSILNVIDFNIYREWGNKVNFKVFDLLFSSPKEAFASSISSPIFLSLIVASTFIIIGISFLHFWIFKPSTLYPKVNIITKTGFSILLIGLCFLCIRGSVGVAPMNPSMVYFSDKPILNHAALNTEWYLIQSCLENQNQGTNPYHDFSSKEACEAIIPDFIHQKNDTTYLEILNHRRPNILFIIMESFTADVVESLGGEKGVSPNFEYWAKKGLLFNHAYAASDRTYKGIVAILSGFPNQGTRNIIEENDKQAKLPAISNTLAKEGYHNSFYYGGELEFANIKSYIYSHRIKKITDIADFEKKDLGSKWGAHDDALYKRVLEKLKNEPQPFFAGLLTLSNHEPFDLPSKHKFGKSTNALAFKSTSYYADSCLHSFLAQASQKAWYKNTLIVITGDHGSPLPRGYINNYEPGRFRIPILFLGGALKKSCEGMVYSKTVNQLDLAATILSQMNLPNHDFFWSRNIFSKNYSPNALFVFNNGFGIVSKNDTLLYDANSAKIISYKGNNSQKDSLLKKGRAYFQLGFQQYLDY